MENEMNTTPAAEEKTSMADYEAELEASLKKTGGRRSGDCYCDRCGRG